MTKANSKFVYFILGIALPTTAYLVWSKTDWFRRASRRREKIDQLQQIAVEDSFPASDPPSAW
jgi:hypothetical protein